MSICIRHIPMAVPVGETDGWYMKGAAAISAAVQDWLHVEQPACQRRHARSQNGSEGVAQGAWLRQTDALARANNLGLVARARAPRSARDAPDLGAFQRQIIHEASRIEDEAEHRARQILGVDRAARPELHDGARSVDARLPAYGVREAPSGFV